MVGPRVISVFGESRRPLRGRAHAPRSTTIMLPLALFAQGDLHPGVVFISCDWVVPVLHLRGPAVDHDRVL